MIDGRGNAYVNNVNFDFAARPPAGDRAPGFVALVGEGRSRVVADDLAFPNGMAVTADNATLIVAESYRHRLTAFDIDADGALSNRRVWADLGSHSPDGICQRVQLDRGAFACMLGGPKGTTLFVAAAHWPGPQRMKDYTGWDGMVVGIRAPAPSAGWPGPG